MNEISNSLLQDGEMLAEYDLSRAVRGNLTLHQNLWDITLAQYPNLTNFQFLIDSQHSTRSVFLDFNHHLPLWQALYSKIIETLPGYDSDRKS
jgi:hypothetical protein